MSVEKNVNDRSAWYGPELAKSEDWIQRLSVCEIAEVEHAFRELSAKQIDFATMTPNDVPLPTLAPRLQQIMDEVLNGRGFVLIKSLPVDRWTRREAALAFLII